MLKLFLIVLFNIVFLPLYLILYFILFWMTFLPIYPVKIARNNVLNRLNLSGIKNRFFISSVFMNYIFYLFEIVFFHTFRLTYASLDKNFVMLDFLNELRKAYPEEPTNGFIYLAGHVANLEFQTIPIVKVSKLLNRQKVLGLAKPSRFKIINKILTIHRVRPGLGMIWTDKNLFENMHKAIEKGCSLCLVADQKPKKNGAFISFFGKQAAFPTTGLKFCMEKKTILIYAFAQRIIPGVIKVTFQCGKNLHLTKVPGNSLYTNSNHLIAGELHPSHVADKKDEIVNLEMAYFVKWLEDNIKKYPAQWCWDYHKWSR